MNQKSLGRNTSNYIRYILFISVLFSTNVHAQYKRSLDSLYQLKTSMERVRGFLGSAEALKLSEEDFEKYSKEVKKIAVQKNDQFLIDHITYFEKHKEVTENLAYADKIGPIQLLAEDYKNKGQMLYAGYCHHFLAQQHFWLQEYGYAFENYFAAYEIFADLGFENVPTISKFLHDFALSRYYFKDYKDVIRLMHIAVKYPPYNSNHDIQRYNNLGAAYSKLQVRDSAMFYFNKTKALGKKYNSKTWEGIIYGNIGDLYFEEQKYILALDQFKQQFEILKNSPFYPLQVSSNINLTKTYLELDSLRETEKFLKIIEKSLNNTQKFDGYGENQQIESLRKDYYDLKSRYLIKVKNYHQAVLYKDSLSYSQNLLASKYNSATIKISEDQLTIKNKELKLLNAETEKANQRFYYSIAIAFLLIVTILIFTYLYMSKLKKKRQNEKLIAQSQIDILEKQKTKKELESAKKDIEQFIHQIHERTEIIAKLESDLNKLKSLELEEKQQVSQTINELKRSKILTNEDWVVFQQNFELIFPDYTTTLKLSVPTLTTSEIRYLMLSKLELNNKEMARVLGVTDTAIRVTLNRLKKKLNDTSTESPNTLVGKIFQNKDILSN